MFDRDTTCGDRRTTRRKITRAALAVVFMIALLAMGLAGCGMPGTTGAVTGSGTSTGTASSAETTVDGGESFRILTSFYPMWLATANIAKGVPGVTIENMTEPQTGCLHDYSLTPRDMEAVGEADVLVINGGGMESFMERVAAQYPELQVITASDGIEMLEGEEGVNPHVWVSVTHAMDQVETIAAGLAEADPAHADAYAENAKAYLAQLEALRERMHEKLDPLAGSPIITFHEAFPYFAEEFGLDIVAVIEREPGSEPGPQEIADTIDLVRERSVKALFAEPQYSPKAAETISSETGVTIELLDPVVTGEAEETQLGRYIELMDRNADTLVTALTSVTGP